MHWRFSKQFSPQGGEPSISAGTVHKHQVHLFLQQDTEDTLGGDGTKQHLCLLLLPVAKSNMYIPGTPF